MFASFLRLLVNPVDAFLFQPPKPSYSIQVRGKLVPEINLICLDERKGFYVVETPNEEASQTCIVWAHGNACDCGEESSGYVHLARELKVVIIAVECKCFQKLKFR